ncbi:hypothetical protein chiPu_0017329 [Chiloscyllium punctatum]|uniref:Uncharacterized protein n=1 Tax=Chiloscyllium punctatum TaxID=137246 RepID=A0A401RF11_CHIPU|nr:hypothetical protein [Chiloscyllium punctatum]
MEGATSDLVLSFILILIRLKALLHFNWKRNSGGKKVESLLEEKNGHMAECEMLLKEDQALCTDLCKTPYYIPTGKVPSPQELELKNHLISTAKEKQHFLIPLCSESIKKEDGTGYKTPLKRTLTAASTSEENPKSQ